MLILRQIFVDVENVNKCKKHILNMLSFEKNWKKTRFKLDRPQNHLQQLNILRLYLNTDISYS